MSPFANTYVDHTNVYDVLQTDGAIRLVPPNRPPGAGSPGGKPPVRYRPAEAGDVGYIVHSWLESYHKGNPLMRQVRFHRYKEPQRRRIHELLGRSHVICACDAEFPDTLYGWACGEKVESTPFLHYVYVAQLWRREGIARTLVEKLEPLCGGPFENCSHLTFAGGRLATKRGVEFNPFMVTG